MAAAAAVYDGLFHGSRNHNHRKHFRPTTSRCPFPTSLRCLNARLSTSSTSSTTTVENKMPMSESHFLKLFNSSCRTYSSLVDACIAECGLRRAADLLDEMSTHGVAPGIDLWKTILAHMCRSNRVDHALHLLNHVVLAQMCRSKRVDDAWHLLKHLSSTASPMPNIHTYNVVLRALLDAGRWVDVESVLAEMFSDGKVLPNVATYNLLIHSLNRAGRVDDAVQVFGFMPRRGCSPNEESYNLIISACCNDGRVDHAVAIFFQRMVAEGGRVMDIRTVNPLVESLCKLQMAVEAARMLRVLRDYCCFQEVSTYNIVVGGLWAQGEKGAAVALLREMLGKGMEPDAVTYQVLIRCLCKDGLVDRARGLAGDMAAAGLRANRITRNVLLRGLCDARMMEEAVEVFLGWMDDDVSDADADRMLNKTYEILSEGIAQVGCTEEAVELAVKLRSLCAISDKTLLRVKWKVNLLANNYNNCSSSKSLPAAGGKRPFHSSSSCE